VGSGVFSPVFNDLVEVGFAIVLCIQHEYNDGHWARPVYRLGLPLTGVCSKPPKEDEEEEQDEE